MRKFILPDVGEGLHEAELVEWLVVVGDHVTEGTIVAVVNTEKVTVELPSPVTGVVQQLHWQAGDTMHVGDPLISFDGGPDEEPDHASAPAPVDSPAGADSGPPKIDLSAALGRAIAAPSTRKFAVEQGIDLSKIQGTGPAGRILRQDVEGAAGTNAPPALDDQPNTVVGGGDVVREKLTGARAKMWQHMTDSSSARATTTTTFTVRMEAVEALLADVRGTAERQIGVLGIAAQCVVRALGRHRRFNAVVDPETEELLVHSAVHLGVAVAAPSGLLVPVIRDADQKRLSTLNDAIHDVAHRARAGELAATELRGGTFTISSTGGLERGRVTSTQPIINLPQVALLWMSRTRDECVIDDGQVRPGRVMSCSLSFDHRHLDGAEATHFINDLTESLERPVRAIA